MGVSNNTTFAVVIGTSGTLVLSLILGSYGYTASEIDKERVEKREWRKEHQQTLDKKFDEVKDKQDKLAETIDKNNEDVKDILRQMLDEQKRSNQMRQTPRRNP